MNQRIALGLDIGHSRLKAIVIGSRRYRFSYPSLVCPAIRLNDEVSQRRAQVDTVEVNGKSYFVGETAHFQMDRRAQSEMGLYDDWIQTGAYEALFRSAIKHVEQAGFSLDDAVVVQGLPARLFGTQREQLLQLANKVLEGRATCYQLPQPAGAYNATILDEAGLPSRGDEVLQESWATIDFGHYSTDLMLTQRNVPIQRAEGSCGGFNKVIEDIRCQLSDRGMAYGPDDIQEVMEQGPKNGRWVLKYYNQDIDFTSEVERAVPNLAQEALDKATSLFDPYVKRLNGVIVAGGPAPLLFPFIHEKWPHAVMIEDPRFSVAEGFARFGRALLMSSSMAVS